MSADLLLHREFVARIARRLIDDESEVEDIVQETCLAALHRQPRTRAWWARVARNLSIDRLRRRAARQRRERAAAVPERIASTAELAERVAWQQRVVKAVLELDLPYREVVLLRFFEDLPPRGIAKRLELPVNTVRTRLRRALQRLRGRLQGEAGGPQALRLLLAPLALLAAPAKATPAAGVATAVAMKKTLLLLALGVMAVTVAGLFALRSGRSVLDGARGRSAGSALGGSAAGARTGASIPDGLAGIVTATVAGPLPAECVAQGGVRMTIRSPDRVVLSEIVAPGAMELRYRREEIDQRLEVSGPRILPMGFSLPRRETDLGEIRIVGSMSFGGRVFSVSGEPLVGAVVHWNKGAASSGPTDREGRYRIETPPTHYGLSTIGGLLLGVGLTVEHQGRWGGPFGAKQSGFALRYDFRADLAPSPVLQFVGVPDARFLLWVFDPGPITAVPGEPEAGTRTDREGVVRPRWPPWIGSAFATLQLAGGERLQMLLDREEVCAGAPYRVGLDETARVSLKVVGSDHEPLRGARLRIIGSWSQDGLRIHQDGRFEVEPGAREVRLFGRVPMDGVLSWRFLADNPRRGVFLPVRWSCETGGRVLRGDFVTNRPSDAALTGGALPTLVIGTGSARRERTLLIEGIAHCERVEFYSGERLLAISEAGPRQTTTLLADGQRRTLITPEATRRRVPDFDRMELVLVLANSRRRVRLTRGEWAAAVKGEPLQVRDDPPTTGRIRVVDAEGRPAPNVMVSVDANSWTPRAATDGNGIAVLQLPGPGPYPALAVDPISHQAGMLDAWTPAGRERTLRLRRPATLRFRILTPDSRPHRQPVTLTSPRSLAGVLSVRGDRRGWFTTPPLVAELYTLSAFAWSKTTYRALTLEMPVRAIRPDQELRLGIARR